jgi:regulator of sigma E protease
MSIQEILIKAAQLILSLSILVVLHELGHFIPAKLFKTRVEKFYLFFDPWFSLFKVKKGETEYGIGWLPLGGYVKIAGMVDESMDREQLAKPPEPWEFRSKPAWQRLIIMIGGVTVNILLGMFIYAMMLWHWGDTYVPPQNMKYGIAVDSLAGTIGLKDGDQILGINNKPVKKFERFNALLILREGKTIQIERNGQQMELNVPEGFVRKVIKHRGLQLEPRVPFLIDSVNAGSAAATAGFKHGDQSLSVNGEPAYYFQEFRTKMAKNKNKPVSIKVLRGTDTVTLNATVPATGILGLAIDTTVFHGLTVTNHYTFLQSFPAGFTKCGETLQDYVQQLRLIFVSKEVKASESLGGFVSIAKLFPAVWDWMAFWQMTALLSIILAFMNILPIPALDGGHVLFLLYEMVTGRKPSEKFLEYAQIVGMVLLFGLLIYANGLDVWRSWFNK